MKHFFLGILLLCLFPLAVFGENNDVLEDLIDDFSSYSKKKIHLSYQYSPAFARHKTLAVRCFNGACRLDSFWKGGRGKRHDLLIVHPKEGIYQGEYYRDSYSLIFYAPFPKGRKLLLSSVEDAETFAGIFLLWSLTPQTMLRLSQPKTFSKTGSIWKGKWGENLNFQITWDKKEEWKLKKFTLKNSENEAYLICKVKESKKVGDLYFIPSKIEIIYVDSDQNKQTSELILEKILESKFSSQAFIPSKLPSISAVDLKLLPIEKYEELLKKDFLNARLWFSLGRAYMYKGQFSKAEKAFLKARDVKPKGGMIYNNLLYLAFRRHAYHKVWQYLYWARSARIPNMEKLYFLAASHGKQNIRLQSKLYEAGLKLSPYNLVALEKYLAIAIPSKIAQYGFLYLQKFPKNSKIQTILEENLEQISWNRIGKSQQKFYRTICQEILKKDPQATKIARILKMIPSS